MHWTPRAIRFLFLLFFATLSAAQTPPSDDESVADKAYQAHDWIGSENAYSFLTKKFPANARFWYRLGTAQKSLGKYDAALASFAKAESAGTPRYLSQYAIAEAQALKGNPTASFTALDEALKAGSPSPTNSPPTRTWLPSTMIPTSPNSSTRPSTPKPPANTARNTASSISGLANGAWSPQKEKCPRETAGLN